MDPALALRRGDALHAVRTALVLEATPRLVTLDDERDVAEAAVLRRLLLEDLELQAAALGEALVHAEEIAGPEVGLLATLGALDLHDHVPTLVRVAWQEQFPDLLGERVGARFLLADLRLQVVAHVGVDLVGEHLTCLGDVLLRGAPQPVRIHERLELGVPPTRIARGPAITCRVDPGQVGFQPLELNLEIVELLEHAPRVPGGTRTTGGC